MDIHDYLGVLRRGWAFLLLGVLVGVGAGAAAQSIQVPSYSATSRDLITNDTSTDLTASLQASNLAQSRIASYVLVVSSGLVLQPVIDELGLDMTVDQLAGHLAVSAPANTLVIEITASAASPALAQRIANATSTVFSTVVANQIEAGVLVPAPTASPTPGAVPTPGATAAPLVAVSPVRVVNIEKATLPAAPNSSDASLFLVVGAFLGLAGGLVGASLRESLDRRIRGRKDVAAATTLPVVGEVRPDRTIRSTPLVVNTIPGGATAESFRALRANLEHIRLRDGRRTFVLAAMGARQGSSTIAANLALAVANTATSVVVVDANLLSPTLSFIFDSAGARGLSDVLTGEADLDSVLRHGTIGDLWLLPAGAVRPGSGELLATQAMRQLLARLEERFDVVLIDAPAIGPVTDAAVLGAFGGATLVVAAEGVATRPALAQALVTLVAGGSTPIGIVLNRIPRLLKGRRSKGRARRLPSLPALAARQRPPRAPKVARELRPSKAPKQKPPRRTVAPVAARTVLDAPPSRFAPDPALSGALKPIVPSAALRALGAPMPAVGVKEPEREEPTQPAQEPEAEIEEQREPRRVTVGGYSNVTAITPAISKERLARENYLLKSRELEHAAKERLAHEQRRLELRIRDQLDHEKRELGLVLDDELEDTVILPTLLADGKV
ncbi:MAG: chromosome partitioning protein [Rhodoglobus sp.]|nr:chromosome partitioning protein [Rhodoglobus sp.]